MQAADLKFYAERLKPDGEPLTIRAEALKAHPEPLKTPAERVLTLF